MTDDHGQLSSSGGGPENVLDALKAFKEAQDRRVAHWKEYDEALEHYERTNLYADEHRQQSDQLDEDVGDAHEMHSTASEAEQMQAHRCGPQPESASTSSSHYHSVALPMTDAIFSKVLALVTSGLLDCSHAVRAIEIELRTTFQRDDLAGLVSSVQEKENGVLRTIVHRDQTKRIAKVEGRDCGESVAQADRQIFELRQEIQELMSEINAEMAEI